MKYKQKIRNNRRVWALSKHNVFVIAAANMSLADFRFRGSVLFKISGGRIWGVIGSLSHVKDHSKHQPNIDVEMKLRISCSTAVFPPHFHFLSPLFPPIQFSRARDTFEDEKCALNTRNVFVFFMFTMASSLLSLRVERAFCLWTLWSVMSESPCREKSGAAKRKQ